MEKVEVGAFGGNFRNSLMKNFLSAAFTDFLYNRTCLKFGELFGAPEDQTVKFGGEDIEIWRPF